MTLAADERLSQLQAPMNDHGLTRIPMFAKTADERLTLINSIDEQLKAMTLQRMTSVQLKAADARITGLTRNPLCSQRRQTSG